MKTRIIIIISVLLAVAIGVHFFIFRSLTQDWVANQKNIETDLPKYGEILRKYDPDAMVIETRKLKEELRRQQTQYDRLRDRYVLDRTDVTSDEPVEKILTQVESIQQMEEETQEVNINVTRNWGIGADFVNGRYGKGLLAIPDQYAVLPGEELTFDREKGTIEFWVKPRWNGRTDDKKRYFINVYGVKRSGKNIEETSFSLYKDEQATLIFEVKMLNRVSDMAFQPVDNWKPGQWHHIAITWNKEDKEDFALYVDGRKAVNERAKQPKSQVASGEEMGYFANMMVGGMMPNMQGFGTEEVTGYYLEYVDEIIVGADRFYLNAANSVFDDLRISDIPRKRFVLNAPIKRDDHTLVLDHLEDHLFDPLLLAEIISRMEAKVRMFTDPSVDKSLKQEKRKQYQAMRKTLGLDDEKLSTFDFYSATIQRLFIANTIRQKIEGYPLNTLFTILGIQVPREAELDIFMTFLDLVQEILEKAIDQNLDVIEQVEILGESTFLDETKLKEFFDKRIEDLGMETGLGYEDGEMDWYSMMIMMAESGQDTGQLFEGMMMPGMMSPGQEALSKEEYAKQQKELERKKKEYRQFKKARDRGMIPAKIRREFNELHKGKEGRYYRRRSLKIEISSNVDKLSEFLHHLEYGDRVSTINTMTIETAEAKELLTANISFDVHVMVPPPRVKEDEGGPQGAEPADQVASAENT